MIAYHVAPSAAFASIMGEGLRAQAPNPRFARHGLGDQPVGVYLWPSLARAELWAEDLHRLLRSDAGLCDIWAVRDISIANTHRDPILGDQGARYSLQSIPANRILPVRFRVRG